MSVRVRPEPPSLTSLYTNSTLVSDGLKLYYKANGLPEDGGLESKWALYKLGPFLFKAFPNFENRNQALQRHDVHHIINDLDTSNLGEGLIGAWELGSGCNNYWISWVMESQALWFGLTLAPRQTWAYFILGRHSQNFFNVTYTPQVLKLQVGELRKQFLPDLESEIKISASDVGLFIAYALMGLFFMPVFFVLTAFFTVLNPVLPD